MISLDSLLSLITSEYRDKPNYIQFLTALLTPVLNVIKLNHDMSTMMNIDTATGKTLDLIGDILSLPRQVNFQPSGGISSVLNDEYYRLILKARIAQSQWTDGTLRGLHSIWSILFPNNPVLIVDHQNMSASVVVLGLNDSLSKDLITHGYIVPKPIGVRYEYGFTEKPIYSQDLDTEMLKGFDEGYWLNLSGGFDGK